MNGILAATLMVGGTGLLIGILLGIAGKKFYVEVDERETKVREALPGNNCGGCGYPGCDGAAVAVVKGEAPVSVCPVGGAPVAAAVGAIMGQKADVQERKKAVVRCAGTCDVAKNKYEYTGARDCSYAGFVPGGGPKSCGNGCLGFGNCVKACKFDAIHIENGIAVVDGEACKACGACVKACPRNLIDLIPYEQQHGFFTKLMNGYVVDFIDVTIPLFNYRWPAFNVADSCIFVAAIIFFIASIFSARNKEEKTS